METDKPQASKSKKDKYISNESNKGMALDKSRLLGKSRAYQRTEIEDIVKPLKKSSISSASLSDKSAKIQQPKEIKFRNDNFISDSPIVSSMSRYGEIITTVSSDKERIARNIRKKKIS